MQKSGKTQKAATTRRKVKTSTTWSRKSVKRPAKTSDSTAKKSVNKKVVQEDKRVKIIIPEVKNPDSEEITVAERPKSPEVLAITEMAEELSMLEGGDLPKIILRGNKVAEPEPAKVEETKVEVKTEVVIEPEPQKPSLEVAIESVKAVAERKDTVEKPAPKPVVKKDAEPVAARLTARELKNEAIAKAMHSARRAVNRSEKGRKKVRIKFGLGRVVLALTCTAAAVFAIVYFVNLNMPDISMKVAAMQTGVDASYPSYVPRDFALSDITSESGKITLNFKNPSTGEAFTLIEEKSSWDSGALLSNYVSVNYGDNYTVVREQGLTLYIAGSDAAWVNGGVVYKIKTTSGSLTKKQIKAIAVSV